MNLSDILANLDYTPDAKTPLDCEIERISVKVDEIEDGDLFILIESINFDIKNILDYINTKRPLAMIAEDTICEYNFDFPVIRVKNSRLAMAYVFSSFFKIDYSKLKIIAVTGTNGKTSTAYMLREILLYDGKKVGFMGTGRIEINRDRLSDDFYSMTTPDPKLLYSALKRMQDENCEYIVMEASSHALFFDKLAPILFEAAIFTNLSAEHLDFHNDVEAYYESKAKLFKMTKRAIINIDDNFGKRIYADFVGEKHCIGIIWHADALARDITNLGFSGIEYIYRENIRSIRLRLKLVGAYNIYNSLLAMKTAIALGVRPCIARDALESIVRIDGRFEVIDSDVKVLIDYAHTPYALECFLRAVNSIKLPTQKLTLVFGCGGERDKSKRPIMGAIAEKNADRIIISSDNARNENRADIISDILSGMKLPYKHRVISSRKKAIEAAIMEADDGDIVAVVGKGHEKYNIDKKGVHPFSESEIIEKALKRRKNTFK